jgi:hypothetical protein
MALPHQAGHPGAVGSFDCLGLQRGQGVVQARGAPAPGDGSIAALKPLGMVVQRSQLHDEASQAMHDILNLVAGMGPRIELGQADGGLDAFAEARLRSQAAVQDAQQCLRGLRAGLAIRHHGAVDLVPPKPMEVPAARCQADNALAACGGRGLRGIAGAGNITLGRRSDGAPVAADRRQVACQDDRLLLIGINPFLDLAGEEKMPPAL